MLVGADECLVQQVSFLVRDILQYDGNEGVERLDFLRQGGGLRPMLPANLVLRLRVSHADFHDVDILRGTRLDADELSSDSITGSLKFIALVRGDGEGLRVLVAQAESHRHCGKGLTCA